MKVKIGDLTRIKTGKLDANASSEEGKYPFFTCSRETLKICIRLNKAILNPLYVAYFMESTAGKEQFESKNQSAVKAGLNFNSINSLRIMVPPISIQEEFVSFVKQVDKSKVVV